eukprot:GDKJ01004494.1.p1 GENE.GDKJ01004494.1~~GDKJ01004494.1.p1  ORF type:complete len:169 (-),score=19.82 GDKJ01004494.1:64-570(-)
MGTCYFMRQSHPNLHHHNRAKRSKFSNENIVLTPTNKPNDEDISSRNEICPFLLSVYIDKSGNFKKPTRDFILSCENADIYCNNTTTISELLFQVQDETEIPIERMVYIFSVKRNGIQFLYKFVISKSLCNEKLNQFRPRDFMKGDQLFISFEKEIEEKDESAGTLAQ